MAEALVTTGLVAVLLLVSAQLFQVFRQRQQQVVQRQLEFQQFDLLQRLGGEAQSSQSISSPGPSGWSSLLQFQRLDPRHNALPAKADDRLPWPLPTPRPGTWDPAGLPLMQVGFRVEVQQLLREVEVGGERHRYLLANDISGFACRFASPQRLEIQLSWQSQGQLQQHLRSIWLPLQVSP